MKIVQFTGAKILTTAGPSITMHSTGFTREVSSKEDKRSDLLSILNMPSLDKDGGNVWFSWLKNSSRLPSQTLQAG